MITKIAIDGFKSFSNFEMEFAPFTLVVGANAAGKSNLFDAIMLLARLAESDNIKKVFREQRGDFSELFSQYTETDYATRMRFEVDMLINKAVKDAWGNEATLKYTRLRYKLEIERFTHASGLEDLRVVNESLTNIKYEEDTCIDCIDKKYREIWLPKVGAGRRGATYMEMETIENVPTVVVPQDGKGGKRRLFPLKYAHKTILSSFDSVEFPHVLAAKEEMRSWKFLQLNPEHLRHPSDKNADDVLAYSGQNMAAVLARLKAEHPETLVSIGRKLQQFVREFKKVDVVEDKEKKEHVITLTDSDNQIFSSRVLSEGTLRILALLILAHDDKQASTILFEEPENGIHPACISDMVDLIELLAVSFAEEDAPLKQIIVNTHSPLIAARVIQNRVESESNEYPILSEVYLTDRVNAAISILDQQTVRFRSTVMKNPLKEWDFSKKAKLPIKAKLPLLEALAKSEELKYALHQIKQYLGTMGYAELGKKLDLTHVSESK